MRICGFAALIQNTDESG